MPNSSLQKTAGKLERSSSLRQYSVLKARVGEVLIEGRARIEREFNQMRYETGRLINEHIRLNDGRANYGAQAIEKLAKDIEIDRTELDRYAQFAKSYSIPGGRRELAFNLPWQHYRKLMVVKNDELRQELTTQAEKNEWTFEEVESKVRYASKKTTEKSEKIEKLPMVCLGPFFTYQIVAAKDIHGNTKELLLDLGFKHRLEANLFPRIKFKEGMFVTAREKQFEITEAKNVTVDSLFTYKARVEDVLDGDTLKIDFHLGLGTRKGETIRLNHIDAYELSTNRGRSAKKFVESELAGAQFITIKSTKTKKEKWGRYLGDVFYQKKNKGPMIYLNQLLLDKNYAVRV